MLDVLVLILDCTFELLDAEIFEEYEFISSDGVSDGASLDELNNSYDESRLCDDTDDMGNISSGLFVPQPESIITKTLITTVVKKTI